MKHHASVKRRTRRRQKKTRKTRRYRRQRRQKQHGGESSVDMPLGSIVIEKDADDEFSPFLAVERDTARKELSASSKI